MDSPFAIGKYRPIYLWGGPGTVRMNKIKFMDYPVNEAVHRDIHDLPAAKVVVDEMNTNWVHLMYDWGFPPEIEQEDWEDFHHAAEVYHRVGSPIFAYIQTSNCVYEGSFISKDWYARDRRGRKIYYYSGRYMVDWTHPEWVQHLKDLIKGALDRGADGIFFDNLWYGEEPNSLMGAWLGGAGCYCPRCQSLYQAETGRSIPEKILPGNQEVAEYLRWRSNQVTATLQDLADTVHSLKPDAPISANDYDVTMRNSYLIYGIDVEALAKIQDIIMVENFALPRWDSTPKPRLANNALTIRNTRELVGDQAHLNVLSYDVGIGFDPVYPPRRHQQGIAEAAACGASMTIKGTEYNDGKQMTLLTESTYHAQHQAIGAYHDWLEANQSLYQNRKNVAPIALLYPGEALWQEWMSLAPIYYGVGQALTVLGMPWRVIREGDDGDNIQVVLTFTDTQRDFHLTDHEHMQIHVPELLGWAWRDPSIVARGGFLHSFVENLGLFLLRSYHSNKFTRKVMDSLNMAKLVTQTLLFNLPNPEMINCLADSLPVEIFPRVSSQEPVLIESWHTGSQRQVHMVNYAKIPQEIRVHFESEVSARVISPDHQETMTLSGESISLLLDIYSVLLID